MSTLTLSDPILGRLAYRRDWNYWSEWVGRAEFKPGQSLEVVFYECTSDPRSCPERRAELLANARATYLKLVDREGDHRLEAACTLVFEGDWPVAAPAGEVTDAELAVLAEQPRLIRVELHDDDSGALVYRGPEPVTGGREIHCSTCAGRPGDVYLRDVKNAAPAGATRSVVDAVQATDLFRALVERYPGVAVWLDPLPADAGCEYCWGMSVEGKEATNLVYFRLQGGSLQLQIKNRHGEVRWLDLDKTSCGLRELLGHVAPRWGLS